MNQKQLCTHAESIYNRSVGNKVVATGIYKQSGAFVVFILFFEIFQILISQDKAKTLSGLRIGAYSAR